MNRIIILAVLYLTTSLSFAQIGIYTQSPHTSAALHIEANSNHKGLLLPQMTTAEKESINLPANSLLVYDTEKCCLSQNIGTEDNPEWICIEQTQNRFLYMPSINIPTPNIGPVATPLDLYSEYQKQFAIPMKKNSSAPSIIPHYKNASDFYYYVTYYDNNILDITNITQDGKMNYTILKKADYDTYMNIVFVIK